MAEEGQLTKNFHVTEVECGCGCGFVPRQDFLDEVQEIRVIYGPMRVNSGARCEDYNESVNGSPRSRHKKGTAVDIHVPDAAAAWRLAKAAMDKGFSIGVYSAFLHLDKGRPEPILFRGDY